MALPLPQVVPNVEAGGPVVTAMRGQNALAKENYDTLINAAKAKYAPWTTYAKAASEIAYANMTPYQVQATMMSNPMLWMALKDNPQALNALMNNWKSSIPTPDQIRTGANMPPPPGANMPTRNGLLSMAMNTLHGLLGQNQPDASQQNAPQQNVFSGAPSNMPSPPSSNPIADSGYAYDAKGNNIVASPNEVAQIAANGNNALVPAAQGGMSGVAGKMTGPYVESPFTPGKSVATDQGVVSVPTGGMTEQAQQAIQGIKNLKPILNNIASGAERWAAPGEKGKIAVGQLMNYLQQQFGTLANIPSYVMKSFGVTSKDISEYADWQAQQEKAVETIMKARQWPQDAVALQKVSNIIHPVPGEGKEYGDRVLKELAELETQLQPSYQQALSGGYSLNQGNKAATANQPAANNQQENAEPTEDDIAFTAKKYNMTIPQVKKYLGIK